MLGIVTLLCVSAGLASGASLPSRIVGGSDTNTATHPHQVSLEYRGSTDGEFGHICGASIIGSRWVLTAAHCLEFAAYNIANFRISLNNGLLDDPDRQVYTVLNIIPHENYDPVNGVLKPAFANDIALIELVSDIDSASQLAIPLIDANAVLDGATCTISGWGYTVVGTGTKLIPNVLQETTGTILTRSECEGQWNTILYPSYSHGVHICINDAQSGSCNGDSGGPMVCNGQLAGVTSWGAAGCDTSLASVYVRVQNFLSWINNNMA